MEAITIKHGKNKGTTIGHIAEMENLNDKIMVLKGSKKVTESDEFDNVFIKPNKTRKEGEAEKQLREEVKKLRDGLKDDDKEFPVIRNGEIVFLERKKPITNQETNNMQPRHTETGTKPKMRRNSRAEKDLMLKSLAPHKVTITTEKAL